MARQTHLTHIRLYHMNQSLQLPFRSISQQCSPRLGGSAPYGSPCGLLSFAHKTFQYIVAAKGFQTCHRC